MDSELMVSVVKQFDYYNFTNILPAAKYGFPRFPHSR